MIQKNKLVMLIVFSMLLVCISYAFGSSTAKITIKIAGEDGLPLPGAKAGVTYQLPKGTEQGVNFVTIEGYTDASGIFTASHENLFRDLSYGATKEGYYKSYGVYEYKNFKDSSWQPWNPTVTLILRKIEKPIPMYARNTKMSGLQIPVISKDVGFDLIEYEWMPPYGKGKHADFIFRLDSRFVNPDNFNNTLTVSFSEKHDGIQLVKENRKHGSGFKLPRFAAKTGYSGKLIKKIGRSPGKPTEDDFEADNNYIFRVRSEERDGKIIRAMYGKIQGDIEVYPSGAKSGRIFFTYYLNPDYTRNLEYGTNLFKNLRAVEEPGLE